MSTLPFKSYLSGKRLRSRLFPVLILCLFLSTSGSFYLQREGPYVGTSGHFYRNGIKEEPAQDVTFKINKSEMTRMSFIMEQSGKTAVKYWLGSGSKLDNPDDQTFLLNDINSHLYALEINRSWHWMRFSFSIQGSPTLNGAIQWDLK